MTRDQVAAQREREQHVLEFELPPLQAQIVEYLAMSPRAVTLRTLAEATARPAPKVWEAVASLELQGYVRTATAEAEGPGRPAKEVHLLPGTAAGLAERLEERMQRARGIRNALRRRSRRTSA